MNSRILFVFHSNFLQGNQGTHNRLLALARALKARGFTLDLFGFEHFSDYTFATFEQDNASEHLIDQVFVYDMDQTSNVKSKDAAVAQEVTLTERIKSKMPRFLKKDFSRKVFHFVKRVKNWLSGQGGSNLPRMHDWSRPGMKVMFREIMRKNEYCAVFNFYNFLTPLFDGVTIPGKLIYFMEDCCFIQQYSWYPQKQLEMYGNLLNDELLRLRLYDEVFCISYDEKILFEKLAERPIRFFPHLIENRQHLALPVAQRKWDVLYIGFQNPYNIEALQWFMDRVHPLLREDIRLVFVGNVTKVVDCVRDNIELIPYVEDLSEVYRNVKLSICPMFHGTGMKIKVVEAMSYGLPVICNERGVDGLPDKSQNGCIVTNDPAEFAAQIDTLLTNPEAYEQAATQICSYFGNVFDSDHYVDELVTVLKQAKKG